MGLTYIQLVLFPKDPNEVEEDKKRYYNCLMDCYLLRKNYIKIQTLYDEEELISIINEQSENDYKYNSKVIKFFQQTGLIHAEYSLGIKREKLIVEEHKIRYEEVRNLYNDCNEYYEKFLTQILPNEIIQILSDGYKYYLMSSITECLDLEDKKSETYSFLFFKEKEMLPYYRNNVQRTNYYYHAYLFF